MTERFKQALRARQSGLTGAKFDAATRLAVKEAYVVLARPRARAQRLIGRTHAEDAEAQAVAEFFRKPPDEIIVDTAPALLKQIFALRLRDQWRRDLPYLYGVLALDYV